MQYVGSCTTTFKMRYANYKSCQKRHAAGKKVPQASFHKHFRQRGHRGKEDWEFILIDEGADEISLRKKESFWQHKLNSFKPEGLNKKFVAIKLGKDF